MRTWRLRCQLSPFHNHPSTHPSLRNLRTSLRKKWTGSWTDDHSITNSPIDARELWSNIQPHYLVIEDLDQDASSPEPHHHNTITASHSTATFSTSTSTATSTISTTPHTSTTTTHNNNTPPDTNTHQPHVSTTHHHYRSGISRASCSESIQIEPPPPHQHPPTPSQQPHNTSGPKNHHTALDPVIGTTPRGMGHWYQGLYQNLHHHTHFTP